MGRVSRTSLPDGYFHVTSRGVAERGLIFRDDDDRKTFLELVGRSVQTYGWTRYASCLMGTHYHLVLETSRQALSDGLHWLHWLYAMRFNAKYMLFGHLFADRFSVRVVESEDYLYDACTYVLLNPVRARLCERVEEWPWSYSRFGLHAT